MRKFISKMKDLRPSDFWGGVKFLLAVIPSVFFKIHLLITQQNYWLICEEKNEAQDNGWCFFQYMNRCHPEQKTIYAIGKKSSMYQKVKSVGAVINYATIRHWIYYLCAEVNISSQKGGKPNAAICYVLEVYGILKNRRVFLAHGLAMNDNEFLHYENTKMWMYITSAPREAEYVKKEFHYPKGIVKCTGMSRYDYLQNEVNGKVILLIPSWRYWLKLHSKVANAVGSEYDDFMHSEYYKVFQSLINNNKFLNILNQYGYKLVFYPHRNVQEHLHCFSSTSSKVILASAEQFSIQELIRKCSIMITDYSSVSFDFAYLRKPVLYYQFDLERFRKYQYREGYFNYEKDGFGPVCYNEKELIDSIKDVLDNVISSEYITREKAFFAYHDYKNSERIYKAIRRKLGCKR